MSRLLLFNRRIDIASDDLYLPGFYILILHLIWLGSAGYVYYAIRNDCTLHPLAVGYVLAHVVAMSVLTPIEIVIIALSMSGSLAAKGRRQFISPFCHLHVIFLFAELVIQCAGFYALYGPSPFQISVYCSSSSSGSSNGSDSTTTTTTTAIVNTSSINLIYMVVYWSFIAATIWILILALFLYLSKKRRRYTNFHKYHELWKSRLDWIFSYFKIKVTNGKDVMTDVAGELADYFKDVDWAPSDIVAGLILVKRKQKRDRDEMLERRRLMAQLKGCSPYHGGTSSARSSMEMYQSPTFRFPPALPVPTTSASSPSFVFVSSSYSPAAAGESPTGHVHSQQSTRLPRIPSSTPPRDNNNPSSTTTTPRPAYRIEFPPIDIPKQVSSCVNTDQPTTTGLAKKLKHQPASTSLTPPPEQQQTQQLAPPHAIIIERANTSTSVTSAAVTTTHNAMDGFMSSPARSTPNQKDADTRSEILCKEDIPDILYFAKYMEMIYYNNEPKKQLAEDLLIHFSDDNDIFKLPYMIVLDHEWESIVIAIRGTFSAADILVDLNLDVVVLDMPELVDAPAQMTHSGMLRSAKNILSDILEKDLLSPLRAQDTPYSHYRVVVTGHSLGAGVGQLLTYFLRKNGFMDARCYAYEPPGMLLTYEAAVYFDNFVLSTIFGDDMVPRCSRNSLEFLKLDVKHCLSTCQQPKYQVLGSALSNRFWNKRRKYRPRFSFKKPKWAIINNSNNNSSNNNQHQNTGTVTPDPAGNVEATSVAAAVAELERVSIELPELHQQQQPPVVMMSSPSLFVAGRILYIEKCRLWNDGKDGDLSWVNGQGNSSYSIFNRRASKTIDRVFTWNRKENNENNNNNTLHQQEHQVQIEEAEPQYGTHHFTTTHQHVHATTRNDIPITFLPKVEGKYAYCPRWAGREEFLTVIVSTSMVSDHWPLEILKQFELQPLGQELIAVQKLKKGLKP